METGQVEDKGKSGSHVKASGKHMISSGFILQHGSDTTNNDGAPSVMDWPPESLSVTGAVRDHLDWEQK